MSAAPALACSAAAAGWGEPRCSSQALTAAANASAAAAPLPPCASRAAHFTPSARPCAACRRGSAAAAFDALCSASAGWPLASCALASRVSALPSSNASPPPQEPHAGDGPDSAARDPMACSSATRRLAAATAPAASPAASSSSADAADASSSKAAPGRRSVDTQAGANTMSAGVSGSAASPQAKACLARAAAASPASTATCGSD
mmetsp:Transcript_2723/g.11004  ORF Transcript_2723/g.11004 Transcript_2723/m.11004 type:complete len:205 (+) Transcript_2723:1209-1823(+)